MMDNNERRFILNAALDLRQAIGEAPGKHLGKRERKVLAIVKRIEEAVK